MSVHERECLAAGLDPKTVARLARRLNAIGKECQKHGITVFGGSGTGDLRTHDGLIVATMATGHWDGGDGAACEDANGLLWGEP